MKIGIVADDITGAGDIGGIFARHGHAVHICSGQLRAGMLDGQRADVVIVDTSSRCVSSQVARERVRAATRELLTWGAERFWKKTCSVFRGNVGPEFEAMLEVLGEGFGLAVAAYPENGRVTRNGIHYVHGRPLAESEFARDPLHPRMQSSLVKELEDGGGRRVALLDLEALRGGQAGKRIAHARADGFHYLLADAESPADIAALARAAAGERVSLGSAGLAEALARLWEPTTPYLPLRDIVLPRSPALIVAGSLMPQSRAQIAGWGNAIVLSAATALSGDPAALAALAPQARERLAGGEHVLVCSDGDAAAARRMGEQSGLDAAETSRRIAAALANLAAKVDPRRLIVLGGETSGAVCEALGIDHSIVLHEIEPGLPLTMTADGRLLVLKSGSFGSPDFVARALAHLEHPKASWLVARMTLDEKIAQLQNEAPAVERLGLPAHNYWNECLHGVARAGVATVFPQAINLAATWDPSLVRQIAGAISDEARAKHHAAERAGQRGIYQGLTFWSPTINLLRDPRWGRGQETYGEDPWLISRLAVAFVTGLQGDHPQYLKVVSTPKHFAVHSGPEHLRHQFDAVVSERDLWESYLPHFEAAIRESGAQSIMTAYNRLHGEPCSSHGRLLGEILRQRWGFGGYVVSDCGAVDDIFGAHGVVATPTEAAARALRAGLDLECGRVMSHLRPAIERELLTEADVDRALTRVLHGRERLGCFDPAMQVPWTQIPESVVACKQHLELSREAAWRSFVLLKNDGLLPLPEGTRVRVIGPHADSVDVLVGNYHGTPSQPVTFRQGLAASADDAAEVVVAVVGSTPLLEGENPEAGEAQAGTGDRVDLALPAEQMALLQGHRKLVVVLTGGVPPSVEVGNAMLWVGYAGEAGGLALADILYGRVSPAGRLPMTVYRDVADLPAFEDYSMRRRTWRFFDGEPLYAFGHGLSYTRFRYALESATREQISVCAENVGAMAADEVVQFYVRHCETRWLHGFKRVHVAAGQTVTLSFAVEPARLLTYDDAGHGTTRPGEYHFAVGGRQPRRDFSYDDDHMGVTARVTI
jgi:beta-glucosidase